jgi:hypothetical protein
MTRRGDPATPTGVVIAGVIAVVVVPGPWDWGAIMVGGVLLAILFGYGQWPDRLLPAIGGCAAVAITGLLIVAYPIDLISDGGLSGTRDRDWTATTPALQADLSEPDTIACRPVAGEAQTLVCHVNPPERGDPWALTVVAALFLISLALWAALNPGVQRRRTVAGPPAPVRPKPLAPPAPLTIGEAALAMLILLLPRRR